jgi:hypothetical protein
MGWVDAEENEAAAAPAMTRDNAKMRTASFMVSNSFRKSVRGENPAPRVTKIVVHAAGTKCPFYKHIDVI